MKKVFGLFILIFFLHVPFCFSQELALTAILPVDVQTKGSSFSVYPNTLNLIAGDLYNSMIRKKIKVESPIETDRKINKLMLNKHYYKLMQDFKNYQSINFQECRILAQKLGVARVILLYGGYDAQASLLKEKKLAFFDFWSAKEFDSFYKLNVSVILIDPYSERVLAEKNFDKDIVADNFLTPSPYFAENIRPVKEIKKFSQDLAYSSTMTFYNHLYNLRSVQHLQPYITRDGAMTTDGHFNNYLNNTDRVIEKKRENFKEWVINNL